MSLSTTGIRLAGVVLANLAAGGDGPARSVVFVLDRDGYAFEGASITGTVSRLGAFGGCQRRIEMSKGACVDGRLIPLDARNLRFEHIERRQAFCFEKLELLVRRQQRWITARREWRWAADFF